MFTQDTLDNFKKITGINVNNLLSNFVYFVNNSYPNIVDYYAGRLSQPDQDSFNLLNKLTIDFDNTILIFDINKRRFKTIDYWDLLDNLEDIKIKLSTITNISKYLRSSIAKGNYNTGVVYEQTLNYNQTLENVSTVLGSESPQNDWVNIALNNDLKEESYNTNGGNMLSITFDRNPNLLSMDSVIDNIVGEKMYGKDIYKNIGFENDDLKVLSYIDTVKQAIDTKINLKKGDVPEFPDDGYSNIVGSDIGAIQFPVLFRQLADVFAKDDSLTGFTLKNVNINKDTVLLDFEVNTRYNQIFPAQLKI